MTDTTDKTQSRRIRVLPEQWARVEKAASGTRQNPNELPGLARHGGPRSARTVRQRRQGSHRACTAVCRSRRCLVVAWPAPDSGRHRRGHGMQRRDADVDGRGGRPRGSTVSVRPDRSETRPPSASSVSQEFRWSNFAGERPEQTESANNSRDSTLHGLLTVIGRPPEKNAGENRLPSGPEPTMTAHEIR